MSLRKKNSHKGDYGHILVLAGSRRYSGAALLCAESALRSGAGMVTLGLPESVHRALIGKKIKELISVPFPENKDGAFSAKAFSAVREFMKQADVLIIGPGMGSDNSTRALARKIVAAVQKPQVVDADALNALAGFTGILKNHRGEIILTPHEKEMSRLFDINIRLVKNNRKLVAKKCAKYYNSIIVLKGHCSIVTDGDKNFYL
ncbi:MAG: NAD(P)H-hydrate dehydratase, partial [Candidatus Omnitrophota bacterium]